MVGAEGNAVIILYHNNIQLHYAALDSQVSGSNEDDVKCIDTKVSTVKNRVQVSSLLCILVFKLIVYSSIFP